MGWACVLHCPCLPFLAAPTHHPAISCMRFNSQVRPIISVVPQSWIKSSLDLRTAQGLCLPTCLTCLCLLTLSSPQPWNLSDLQCTACTTLGTYIPNHSNTFQGSHDKQTFQTCARLLFRVLPASQHLQRPFRQRRTCQL